MTLAVPRSLLARCASEAETFAPLETGGLFLGHRLPDGIRAVEHMIGPGPRARHHRTWLEVDHDWQNEAIAKLHAAGATTHYLGEWHSHPAASCGQLSRTDENTLADLAAFPALRCLDPIMVILYPSEHGWHHAAWHLRAARLRLPWSKRCEPVDVVLTV